jgi:hypothetical protein
LLVHENKESHPAVQDLITGKKSLPLAHKQQDEAPFAHRETVVAGNHKKGRPSSSIFSGVHHLKTDF